MFYALVDDNFRDSSQMKPTSPQLLTNGRNRKILAIYAFCKRSFLSSFLSKDDIKSNI